MGLGLRNLILRTRRGKYNNHAAWREINGKRYYFKSKWEANYARYLDWMRQRNLIADWLYEPQTFTFPDTRGVASSYKPDFRVLRPEGSHYWVEVKGYMTAASKTKLRRFERHFPGEVIMIVGSDWFAKNNEMMKGLVRGWE
jgi:hypothetical protein